MSAEQQQQPQQQQKEDALYDRIKEQRQKTRYPKGKPTRAPLEGIEEAVTCMSKSAEAQLDKDPGREQFSWTFFHPGGRCIDAPCQQCVSDTNPLQTTWWRKVNAWAEEQTDLGQAIDEEHGGAAGSAFLSAGRKRNRELESAIQKAVTERHPKMATYWNNSHTTLIATFQDEDSNAE